jgi:iron(III) transport system substrate-binding protein
VPGARDILILLATGLALAGCTKRDPRIPPGYPRSYADVLRQADGERQLLIWSATDKVKIEPLLNAFRRAHPGLTVSYVEMSARMLNDRFLDAVAKGKETPDFLWSSAMDLQIKLTNDGYAQSYDSPEAKALPEWANWKNQAWGVTAEPIVMIYNRTLIADAAAPTTRAALTRLLEQQPAALRGRVATYDVENSAVGYLYLIQDQQATHDIWRLVRAMSANQVKLYDNAEPLMQAVRAGKIAIGYNIIGSYARDEVRHDPNLGMVLPRDYTLVMSRIALIPAAAPHPAAARLFIDFLLSRRGQQFLAARSMPSVRSDVPTPEGLSSPGVSLRAIRVGPALLVDRDALTRRYFLKRWNTALHAGGAGLPAGDTPAPRSR